MTTKKKIKKTKKLSAYKLKNLSVLKEINMNTNKQN